MQIMDILGFGRQPGDDSMTKEDKALILEALNIGRDAVYQDALDYHELWKGWRRKEHELMDQDVNIIDRVIELLTDIEVYFNDNRAKSKGDVYVK